MTVSVALVAGGSGGELSGSLIVSAVNGLAVFETINVRIAPAQLVTLAFTAIADTGAILATPQLRFRTASCIPGQYHAVDLGCSIFLFSLAAPHFAMRLAHK